MKIAVVGATGLVGKEILQVLEERNVPVTEFLPVASSNSVGKKVIFSSEEYEVISIENAIAKKPDIAIFSAGGETSLKTRFRLAKKVFQLTHEYDGAISRYLETMETE